MKVKDLLEKLKEVDEDLDVVIRDGNDGHDYPSLHVSDDGVFNGAAALIIEFLY